MATLSDRGQFSGAAKAAREATTALAKGRPDALIHDPADVILVEPKAVELAGEACFATHRGERAVAGSETDAEQVGERLAVRIQHPRVGIDGRPAAIGIERDPPSVRVEDRHGPGTIAKCRNDQRRVVEILPQRRWRERGLAKRYHHHALFRLGIAPARQTAP